MRTMVPPFVLQLWQNTFEPHNLWESLSLYPVLLRPQSRGAVRLRSTNPYEHPLIDPRYLTHPMDLRILVDGRLCYESIGRLNV